MKSAIIIDPAWEFDKIEKFLLDNEFVLKAILLTHHHPDHSDLASLMSEKFSVPVFVSREEATYYGFSCSGLEYFYSESRLPVEGFDIIPLFTPGHTWGSVCYHIGDNLFTGDTIFIEGCGICFGAGGSAQDMYHSLQKIKQRISRTTKIFPGHCFGTPVGAEFSFVLENNIYFHIKDINQFILFRMRNNQKNLFSFK